MTDETPTAPASPEANAPAQEPVQALVLEAPAAVPVVSTKQAEVSTKVEDATAKQIEQALYNGQEELQRDNAAIEQEKVNLWQMKGRLEQYSYMASKLDEALESRVHTLELGDPEKAKRLQEDVLFYVRQKRTDVLTQLA